MSRVKNSVISLIFGITLISSIIPVYALPYGSGGLNIDSSGDILGVFIEPDTNNTMYYSIYGNANVTMPISKINFIIYSENDVDWDVGQSIISFENVHIPFFLTDVYRGAGYTSYSYHLNSTQSFDLEAGPLVNVNLFTNMEIDKRLGVRLEIDYNDTKGNSAVADSKINYLYPQGYSGYIGNGVLIGPESTTDYNNIDKSQEIIDQIDKLVTLQNQTNKIEAMVFCNTEYIGYSAGVEKYYWTPPNSIQHNPSDLSFDQCVQKVLGDTK